MPAAKEWPAKKCLLEDCGTDLVHRKGESTSNWAKRKYCSLSHAQMSKAGQKRRTCKSEGCGRPVHAQDLCGSGYQQLRAGTYAGICVRGEGNPWRIPEDGIVDQLAVDLASHGTRQVRLTPTEAQLALQDMATRFADVVFSARQRGFKARSDHGLFIAEAAHRLCMSANWIKALVYSGTIVTPERKAA